MRDALSLLDQCAAFSDHIDAETVSSAAGIAGREYLFELCDAVLAQDAAGALKVIDRLYELSVDLQQLCSELIMQFRNMMILKTVSDPGDMITVLPEESERLRALAKAFPMSAVLHALGSFAGMSGQDWQNIRKTDRVGNVYDPSVQSKAGCVDRCVGAKAG